MRIATWNILSGRTPRETAVDQRRFGDAVASLDADLLGLQEVDRAQQRSGGLDLTEIAAAAMGATCWMFAPALAGTPADWQGATGREGPDEPAYGVAFLSRHPVLTWDVVPLAPAPVPVPYRWPSRSSGRVRPRLVRDEPRVALVADVAAPDGELRVVTTHLSFLPVSNGPQLRHLMARLAKRSGRLVLMGDLNMGRRRAERLTGLGGLASGPTFPSDAPTRQIDHVLARGVRRSGPAGSPVRLPVSDHRALVAEI